MPLSGVSIVVFDAYGTLFDLSRIADATKQDLGDRALGFSELWRRKQLEYTWLRSLMGRHTDFWHITGESLDYAMRSLKISDMALRSRLMEAYLTPPAYADAAKTLADTQTLGLKTAILSNGSPTMLTSATKSSGLDLCLDAILSVESVGVFKPHPSVYRLVEDHFSCTADSVAFVTANGWDAAGAAAAGFRVAWLNRGGAPREVLPASPLLELTDLTSLPALLEP
ncbi:MAG TPA: haloacid dehalogenase type II [Rhodospirillaceae bacterium]|nr:haloacid dehalogenase type II [Rhodospirillaceae bacterium]